MRVEHDYFAYYFGLAATLLRHHLSWCSYLQWEVILRLVVATGDEKTYARHRAAGVNLLKSFYRQSAEAMEKDALIAGMRALESSALPGLRAGVGKADRAVHSELIDLGGSLRQPYDTAACGESLSTEVVLLVGLRRVALEHRELREVASPFWPPSDGDDIISATGRLTGTSDELKAAFDTRVALWEEQIDPDQAARVAGCELGDVAEHNQHHAAQRAKDLLRKAVRMARWEDVAATARSLYAQSFQS